MLSSPDAGNSQLQACLAVSQDGSSANSEKESATDGGDDEITVGDVVLKRTSLDGASMELWIPDSREPGPPQAPHRGTSHPDRHVYLLHLG